MGFYKWTFKNFQLNLQLKFWFGEQNNKNSGKNYIFNLFCLLAIATKTKNIYPDGYNPVLPRQV